MEKEEEETKGTRIALVNRDRCKPRACKQECKHYCPVVKIGKNCVEVNAPSKHATISEELCIGCGICVKKCPFQAIQIVTLPKGLSQQTVHRYGSNSFMLHRLPTPRPGQALGLVGANGIGKSTALKILATKLKPNLGRCENPPDWQAILDYFHGTELQRYFTKILDKNLKAIIKPQYLDHIPTIVTGTVGQILAQRDTRNIIDQILSELQLEMLVDRQLDMLGGGELQRFAIAVVAVQEADVYMFDEPSSYLDIVQRVTAARVIRSLLKTPQTYVISVDHDLSMLEYLSDSICVLYGLPESYGVVTVPFSVKEGINVFLSGFVPNENLRFRDIELKFERPIRPVEARHDGGTAETQRCYQYPNMTQTYPGSPGFKLSIESGEFTDSEIIVLLGQNGTGKTTFMRMLAGILFADENSAQITAWSVSYKPQMISPRFVGTVRQLFTAKIREAYIRHQFISEVINPLRVNELEDRKVHELGGGELQRVALCLALGKPADVYLLDEPSSYLDSEMRIIAAWVIKRFILCAKKTAFIVEHDFILASYLADRVIVHEGQPAVECKANKPEPLLSGMNRFLKSLDVTFRCEGPSNFCPMANELDSIQDIEQKSAGKYFFIESDN